jgi:hypothetical protein
MPAGTRAPVALEVPDVYHPPGRSQTIKLPDWNAIARMLHQSDISVEKSLRDRASLDEKGLLEPLYCG